MSISVAAHAIVNVGEQLVVESSSPKAAFGVVFEDDGDTGYFYGIDLSRKPQAILDALLIYDVAQVLDRDVSSTIQIAWSSDGLSAALLLNSDPHAIFDFAAHRGYCRMKSPISSSGWTKHDHAWDENAWLRMQSQASCALDMSYMTYI
jgi:hypothetical protein